MSRRCGRPTTKSRLHEDAERDLAMELGPVRRCTGQESGGLPSQCPDDLPVFPGDEVLPVLPAVRRVARRVARRCANSRLVLCDVTGRTIEQGLALLGIGVVDKM